MANSDKRPEEVTTIIGGEFPDELANISFSFNTGGRTRKQTKQNKKT